ncbi:unnamed protein product, partial [Coregonus sp. 'balchen']
MSMSYQSVNSSIDPTDGGDQIMDERVHLQRPVSPAPSYVSMKSDKSMNVPLGFKEGELTQQEGVLLERAESPALSYASAKSHQSLNTDEEDEEVNSAQKEKCSLKKILHLIIMLYVLQRNNCVFIRIMGSYSVFKTFDREQCQSPRLASVDEVLPPPGEIQFLSVTSDSVSLSWGSPEGMTGPQKFIMTWGCDGEERSLRVEDGCNIEIDGLQPGKKYQFSVATEGEDGSRSRWVSESVF